MYHFVVVLICRFKKQIISLFNFKEDSSKQIKILLCADSPYLCLKISFLSIIEKKVRFIILMPIFISKHFFSVKHAFAV